MAATIAIYAVGLAVVGVRDAVDALFSANPVPLVAAAGLEVVTIGTLAMVHKSSADAVRGELRYGQALNVSMSWFTLSQTVPGGGAVASAEATRRLTAFGMSGPAATASVALTATLATSAIAAIAAIGIGIEVVDADLPAIALVGVLVLLAGLLGVVAVIVQALRSPGHGALEWFADRSERIRRNLDDWRESLDAVADDPPSAGQLLRITAWSAVNWSADIVALGLVFLAFDLDVSPSLVLVGFAVSQVGAAIPVTPGGVGFVESGMVGAFVTLGTPASQATTVVLVYRVLATWGPALAGLVPLLRAPARDPATARRQPGRAGDRAD